MVNEQVDSNMEGWLVAWLEVGSWRPDVGGPKADWQAGRLTGWLVGWLQNGSWRLDHVISWKLIDWQVD